MTKKAQQFTVFHPRNDDSYPIGKVGSLVLGWGANLRRARFITNALKAYHKLGFDYDWKGEAGENYWLCEFCDKEMHCLQDGYEYLDMRFCSQECADEYAHNQASLQKEVKQ